MTAQKTLKILRPRARLTGVIYLLYFLTAILAQFLAIRHLAAYSSGTSLIATAFYCFLTLLFYGIFKPVSRMISFIAALFSLVGCVLMTLSLMHPATPTLSPLLFFGPYCLLIGYLIFQSTFLPRILGVLMALAGAGWLVCLIPHLPHFMSLFIDALGIGAEAALMLWLLTKGVNISRWKHKAGITEK